MQLRIVAVEWPIDFVSFPFSSFQNKMQPFAIKKNRSFSLTSMGLLAALGTTIGVLVYRQVIGPWRRRSRYAESEAFAENYVQWQNKKKENEE